ncbi:MAG TPA: hypothetical protein VFG10_07480 [Saprospiraceae bacterium]|nr:hypothetical protein [Saprospiraceae bacterium]
MKHVIKSLLLFAILGLVAACAKDEGSKPNISYKSGPLYVTADISLAAGSLVAVGINASKASDGANLKKFTVTKSVNGGAATTAFSQDLSGTEVDSYSYDYTEFLTGNAGNTIKYTFTITDVDGVSNSLSLTVTIL